MDANVGMNPPNVNRLLCTVSSHLWVMDSAEELDQLGGMMEALVRGGATEFLPAILKGCWAASACRSDRNIAGKVQLFCKLLELGEGMLTSNDLHEALRVASMACACVWSEVDTSYKAYGADTPSCTTSHPHSPNSPLLSSTFLDLRDSCSRPEEPTRHEVADETESTHQHDTRLEDENGSASSEIDSAKKVRPLLEICRALIEAGASDLNKIVRDIISYKIDSPEVVRTFLQAGGSQRVDVEKALRHATACSSPLEIIAVLIKEGGARELSRPMMLAAINGFLPAVELFVQSGCDKPQAIYGSLYCAVVAGQTAIIDYFLDILPKTMGEEDLRALLRTAASDENSVQGIEHLLRSNFLNDMEATLHAAEDVASLPGTKPEVREALRQEWSVKAFEIGRSLGELHHLSVAWVLKNSDPSIPLRNLPMELQAAMAYLPLYEECRLSSGSMLTERKRGELVEGVSRLYAGDACVVDEDLVFADKDRLLSLMWAKLPWWTRSWKDGSCKVEVGVTRELEVVGKRTRSLQLTS